MSTRAEWSARIYCKSSEVGGSFSVFIFLGDVPTDPGQWLNDPAFAGVFDVYADESANDNDNEQRASVVHGFVHLNRAILERSRQNTLEADVVVPFLKQRLNWAVQRVMDGECVNLDKIPSLEVTVLCTPLTLPVGGKHPTEGKPVYYHDITRGRPGGYKGFYES